MAGRVDWANFVQKIYEAFDKKMNSMVYTAVMNASVAPASDFQKSGDLDEAKVLELIENVQAATGEEVVILGSKSALAKLNGLVSINWISDAMKEERHTTGRIGIWEGTRTVEIPQVLADGSNNTAISKLVDTKTLLFMPVGDNKFVKVFDEGDAQVKEVSDGNTNMDKTIEYEYQQELGVATMVNKKFGKYAFN